MKSRRRRCKICQDLFEPDTRLKKRQYACPKASCQKTRQYQNVEDWYRRNPDCLEYRQKLTREWFKARPDYSRKRRFRYPRVKAQNLFKTTQRMKRLRAQKAFDKTKSILTQVLQNKWDKCFLNTRTRWMHLRLTKQSRLKRLPVLCQDAGHMLHTVPIETQGNFYDLSEALSGA